MKILTIIPARGGSKEIANKNLADLGKKKLIDYSLETAGLLPNYCYTFISSDSNSIIQHCKKKGFYSNYKRPPSLSSDNSKIVDCVFHALNWLEKEKGLIFDAVLLFQPTSPFRNIIEVKKAINKFKKDNTNSMVGVVQMQEHPRECIIIKGNKWNYLKKGKKNLNRRQNYEKNYYFIDGSFYLAKTSFIKKHKSFVVENKSLVYKFNGNYTVDIDSLSDLKLAEAFLKIRNF